MKVSALTCSEVFLGAEIQASPRPVRLSPPDCTYEPNGGRVTTPVQGSPSSYRRIVERQESDRQFFPTSPSLTPEPWPGRQYWNVICANPAIRNWASWLNRS